MHETEQKRPAPSAVASKSDTQALVEFLALSARPVTSPADVENHILMSLAIALGSGQSAN